MSAILPFRRRRPRPERPDAHEWANRIRTDMGWSATCGEPGHLVDTPFRRSNKWAPVDECILRDRARQQLARTVTP